MYAHTHPHTLTPSHPDRMWSVALGLAAGMGVVMGSIKYRHGDYLPDFPTPQTAANLHTQNTSNKE